MLAKERLEKGLYWSKNWELLNGCEEVSPACTNCFAREYIKRFESTQERWQGLLTDDGKWNGTIKLCEDHLDVPRRVKKPTVWFVTERGDIFHPSVPNWFLIEMWKTMEATPWHTYIVLTKRATEMRKFFDLLHKKPPELSGTTPLKNVWLGVTAESNQYRWRIEELAAIKGYKKFVSYEPMIGPLDLYPQGIALWAHIHLVIAGDESGPNARPSRPEWILDILGYRQYLDIFVKQLRVDGKMVKLPEIDGKVWNQLPWDKNA